MQIITMISKGFCLFTPWQNCRTYHREQAVSICTFNVESDSKMQVFAATRELRMQSSRNFKLDELQRIEERETELRNAILSWKFD